jgi:hypothetical protein
MHHMQDDPVVRAMQLMGARRIGEERREVPTLTVHVHDGKPGEAAGVETPGRNELKLIARSLAPVERIDFKKQIDRRDAAPCDAATQAAEPFLQRGAKGLNAARSEAGHTLQASIIGGGFQFFERVDMQLTVEALSRLAPDAARS